MSSQKILKIRVEGTEVTLFTVQTISKEMKTIHGTTVPFLNMVVGVSEGFKKELEMRVGWLPCTTSRQKACTFSW